MSKNILLKDCDKFVENIKDIVEEQDYIKSLLISDIVFYSKVIRNSVFPPSKKFEHEIKNIYDIVIKYYDFKGDNNVHPYLLNKDEKIKFEKLAQRTDPEALSIILTKIPKYRNILNLIDIYNIIRIINEFNIDYAEYIKVKYYEQRLIQQGMTVSK